MNTNEAERKHQLPAMTGASAKQIEYGRDCRARLMAEAVKVWKELQGERRQAFVGFMQRFKAENRARQWIDLKGDGLRPMFDANLNAGLPLKASPAAARAPQGDAKPPTPAAVPPDAPKPSGQSWAAAGSLSQQKRMRKKHNRRLNRRKPIKSGFKLPTTKAAPTLSRGAKPPPTWKQKISRAYTGGGWV